METTFTLTLDDIEYSIEVHGNTFIINGRPFIVGLENTGVTVDGIAYDVKLQGDQALINGITHAFAVSGLETVPGKTPARPAPAASGAGVIHAIMPGTIVRVLVEEGASVTAGDVILVLEAMKMENELRAPVSGTVKAIHVQTGQAVETNAVLAEIEPGE